MKFCSGRAAQFHGEEALPRDNLLAYMAPAATSHGRDVFDTESQISAFLELYLTN